MHPAYTLHLTLETFDTEDQMSGVFHEKSIVFDIFAAFFKIGIFRHSQLNMNKLLTLFLLLISTMLTGQGAVNSPFSRFGIGDLN